VKALRLKAGREKSLRRRHPWIFSGAVARVEGDPQAGETVRVESADGKPLALAAYSPHSQIRARTWTFDISAEVNEVFLRSRIERAISWRESPSVLPDSDALRLVHGESDGLPGLVVDRYGNLLVAQFLAAGAERWREEILDALEALTGADAIFERSDAEVRKLEGLEPRAGFVRGSASPSCVVREHGLRFHVDIEAGQKTGFYLDQRANRQRVRALAAGREVLDAFCYTGGFALAALAGGAKHVTAVESSAAALAVAKENLRANSLDADAIRFEQADVFAYQRALRDQGRRFGLIALDPPKFAPTAAQAKNAARAYKDINLLALKLLSPGGLLATFSCSGGVGAELFQSIVAGAAADAGVDAKILERFGAAPDHPVALEFPEGEYLKGLLLMRA